MPTVTELTSGQALIYSKQLGIHKIHRACTSLNFPFLRFKVTGLSG